MSELVQCEFSHLGCEVKLTREEMERHLKDNLQAHMALMNKALLERVEQKDRKIEELKGMAREREGLHRDELEAKEKQVQKQFEQFSREIRELQDELRQWKTERHPQSSEVTSEDKEMAQEAGKQVGGHKESGETTREETPKVAVKKKREIEEQPGKELQAEPKSEVGKPTEEEEAEGMEGRMHGQVKEELGSKDKKEARTQTGDTKTPDLEAVADKERTTHEHPGDQPASKENGETTEETQTGQELSGGIAGENTITQQQHSEQLASKSNDDTQQTSEVTAVAGAEKETTDAEQPQEDLVLEGKTEAGEFKGDQYVQTLERQIQELAMKLENTEKLFKEELQKKDLHIRTVEAKVAQLEAQVHRTGHQIEEVRGRTGVLPYFLSMHNFQKLKSSNTYWTSPPLYTHPGGYKLCLRVYPNGIGEAGSAGTQVAVELCSMKSENDHRLKWPADATITLQLVNQHRDQHHVTVCKRFRWHKPSTAYPWRIDWFTRQLVAHNDLVWNSAKQLHYLKNDSLVFKVTKIDVHVHV